MTLTSEAQLAADFGIDEARAAELRRKHDWPHVRLGRFDVRYTEAQVEQIIAMQSVTPTKAVENTGSKIAGQTARSASRKKAS